MITAMFDAYCHRHGARVLLGERRITALRNDATGIHIRFRCWCGEEGEVVTGRARPRA
jgi:hypothetical protein